VPTQPVSAVAGSVTAEVLTAATATRRIKIRFKLRKVAPCLLDLSAALRHMRDRKAE
jgi:hypothetical protein